MAPAVLFESGQPMNDFLSHVAARSLQAAETVKPRLASLFEPLGPADLPGARPAWEVTGLEVAPSLGEGEAAGLPANSTPPPVVKRPTWAPPASPDWDFSDLPH